MKGIEAAASGTLAMPIELKTSRAGKYKAEKPKTAQAFRAELPAILERHKARRYKLMAADKHEAVSLEIRSHVGNLNLRFGRDTDRERPDRRPGNR